MNSLTKDRRIRKNNEYQLVYKHGRYEVGRLCVVYHMPWQNKKVKLVSSQVKR